MDENQELTLDLLLEIYKVQWEDIHHTRDQDWELSKLVLAGFLGLSGLTAFATQRLLIALLAISFILLSIMGILVTIRHKNLFQQKMNAILILEHKMKVDQLNLFGENKSNQIFTTQNILLLIYTLSALIFGVFLFLQAYP